MSRNTRRDSSGLGVAATIRAQLTLAVAPRLVGGEEDPVLAEAALLDRPHQPARGEADGPAGVGVDALAGGDPVEEPTADQLDVAATCRRRGARGGWRRRRRSARRAGSTWSMSDEPPGEVWTWTTRSCSRAAAKIRSMPGWQSGVGGSATEQEAQLERPHAGLTDERERLLGALDVVGAGRHPQRRPGPDRRAPPPRRRAR